MKILIWVLILAYTFFDVLEEGGGVEECLEELGCADVGPHSFSGTPLIAIEIKLFL